VQSPHKNKKEVDLFPELLLRVKAAVIKLAAARYAFFGSTKSFEIALYRCGAIEKIHPD
jgi:hypothetical protein